MKNLLTTRHWLANSKRLNPLKLFFSLMLIFAATIYPLGCESEDTVKDNPSAGEDITYEAVYVVNGGSNSVSVINAATNTVSKTITLVNFSWPHHIYLSPDGKSLVIGVPGVDLSGGHGGGHGGDAKGGVVVLDAITGTVKATKELGASNHNGIFSPDGTEIWTAIMKDAGSVLICDAGLTTVIKEILVGSLPAEVTFSKDGKYAFVANGGSRTVTVIDVATQTVQTTIPVGKNPVGAWPGIDGRMYVDNEEDKTVSIIDPTSLAVVQTINLGFTPGFVATPPSVEEFWVSDPDGAKVHYYRRSDGSRIGAFNVGAGAHAIAFNASGTIGYVTNQEAGTVSVVDVAKHTATKTLIVGTKPNGLVWRARK